MNKIDNLLDEIYASFDTHITLFIATIEKIESIEDPNFNTDNEPKDKFLYYHKLVNKLTYDLMMHRNKKISGSKLKLLYDNRKVFPFSIQTIIESIMDPRPVIPFGEKMRLKYSGLRGKNFLKE